ncbi:MAG: cisplatin damage response ATP-dependent DNA ligase [Sphingorhabdus sp.]
MQAFSALIDGLIYTRSRDAKIKLIADYLRSTPDPDRGWALAALAGTLNIPTVKSGAVRAMAEARFDPALFRLSRDYVGDTAETVALMWDDPAQADEPPPSLNEVVELLKGTSRAAAPVKLAEYMGRLDANGRFALLKLASGGMRVGISARLAKTAFASAFGKSVDDIEELWHALKPPFTELFDWGEGRAGRPDTAGNAFFRPFMLAHPLDDVVLDLSDFAAEWKWDGIRIQIASTGGQTKLFSRGGDEITSAFPEIAAAFGAVGVLDGELLVRGDLQGGEAASFNTLQQRLGRKSVTTAMQKEYPVFVRLYDILFDKGEDLRAAAWVERRKRLELFVKPLDPTRFDLSAIIQARDFNHLCELREGAREAAIEGVMLKRRDAPYVAGRRTGLWFKWKRAPLVADCVMMYAQRGSGKRSSYFSDFTFGCWSEDGTLLPVGKAYSGFSDVELKWLDRFVRDNTVARFGPVREVEKSLVLEVAFDAIHESKRHKSGLAMRFPRISRLRRDKPADEADRVDSLRTMIG